MTDPTGPNLCKSLFGGTIRNRIFTDKNWKDQYEWRLVGRKAVEAIRQLEPYLRVKRKQAQAILRSEWKNFAGFGIPDEERKLRNEIRDELTSLNKKGK